MKKNLLYLVMLFMSVSMFTACSDDDDDSSPISGTWKLKKVEGAAEIMVNIESSNDSVTITYPATEGTPEESIVSSNEEFAAFFKMILGGIAGDYLSALNWIEFQDNGDIRLSYTSEGTTTILPAGMVRHYPKGDKIYFGVSKDLLASLGDIDFSKISGIKEMHGDIAMPLLYRTKGNETQLFVNKEMMMPFFDIAAGLMPEMGYIVAGFKSAIAGTTTFELGLVLETTTAVPVE